METVCSTCGEQNPPETQFCWSCRAYLGWQDDSPSSRTPPVTGPTPVIVPPSDEPPSSAGVGGAGAADERRDPFETGIDGEDVTVPVDGTPVTVTVNVSNTSGVVDGYVVEGLNAPPWLEVRPGTTELLPSTSGTVTTELRIVSSTLVPAQKLVLLVRLRNTTGRFAYRDMSVRVTVPVVEAPFQVRAEPQLIRARDHSAGVCTVVVENPRSNRWARVRLSATDPEQAVRTTWRLPQLDVPPGRRGEDRRTLRGPASPSGRRGQPHDHDHRRRGAATCRDDGDAHAVGGPRGDRAAVAPPRPHRPAVGGTASRTDDGRRGQPGRCHAGEPGPPRAKTRRTAWASRSPLRRSRCRRASRPRCASPSRRRARRRGRR